MNITYYRYTLSGAVESKPMGESSRDYHVASPERTYSKSHVMNGVTGHRVDTTTRDGRSLRVDWLATPDGNAYVWFVEEGEAPAPKGPESLGTIWVCQDCMLHHANGECGGCHEGHDEEPLNRIDAQHHAAMGLAWDEHAEDCQNRIEREWRGECDCERREFSRSQCEGCGSYLHGERHAMTLFRGA